MNPNALGIREGVYEWWESFTDPYERLENIAQHILIENPEATFYDLFNYIRSDIFKGWEYDEDSDFIRNIDLEIERKS